MVFESILKHHDGVEGEGATDKGLHLKIFAVGKLPLSRAKAEGASYARDISAWANP